MRVILKLLLLLTLTACSQQDMVLKFSTPEDRATAQRYIDDLRARRFDEIEKALDPRVRAPDTRNALTKMAALIPNGEPTSVKVVGVNVNNMPDAKTVNTTFEYNFGDIWLLANVVVLQQKGATTIVGFHVNPMGTSLETQNRFTFAGKSPVHYTFLAAGIAVILLTVGALIICARTNPLKRKWLWMLFILLGFGKVAFNWTTGQWGVVPLTIHIPGVNAFAAPYGPWIFSVALPLGAIVFLCYRAVRRLPAQAD